MRVLRLKEVAKSYNLKPAKSFTNPENYLEYVIATINEEGDYKFHQFFALSDVLYIILDPDIKKQREQTSVTPKKKASEVIPDPNGTVEQQNAYFEQKRKLMGKKIEETPLVKEDSLIKEAPLIKEDHSWNSESKWDTTPKPW